MKILYLVGEIAKLHGISKQTLIYYDKIDLFRPQHCDDETGYRYYSLEQFIDLDVVLCLKNFGMPLSEIRTYLKQSTIDERIAMLDDHRLMVAQKISDLQTRETRLKKTITNLQTRSQIEPFEIGIKSVPQRRYVSVEVTAPYNDKCLEIAIKSLFEKHTDRSDTGIDELLFFTKRGANGINNCLLVGLEVEETPCEILPEAEVAYIYHKGPFETANVSHEKLMQYIEKNGYCPTPYYSVKKLLLDALAVSNNNEYLMEIQIAVEKREECA